VWCIRSSLNSYCSVAVKISPSPLFQNFPKRVKAVTEKTPPLKKGNEEGFECDFSRGHRLDLLNDL
jgi:hypothetical protein